MPRLEPAKKNIRIKLGWGSLPFLAIALAVVFVALWFFLPTLLKGKTNNASPATVVQTETSNPEQAAADLKSMHTNDIAQANAALNKSIVAKSDQATLIANYNSLGLAYYNDKQYDLSIAAQEQVLKYSPENIGAITGLALAYEGKQQYQKAIDQYELAITISKKSSVEHATDTVSLWEQIISGLKAKL